MENSGKKYQIDTEENKMFLGELQKNLLNFGKGFYHREEVLISLGMMEHHGKTETEKHGSHAVWSMYIVWESCLGIKKVRHWSMVLNMDYWKN